MSTFLRRALPTVLVTSGLVLVTAGVLSDAGDHTVPGALLLLIAGGAAALYVRLNRPRRATPVLRVVPPVMRMAPLVPTQRSAPHCAIPAPRSEPDLRSWIAGDVVRPVAHPAGRTRGAHAGHPVRGGVRHCVVPRGEVPHQRRATDGS